MTIFLSHPLGAQTFSALSTLKRLPYRLHTPNTIPSRARLSQAGFSSPSLSLSKNNRLKLYRRGSHPHEEEKVARSITDQWSCSKELEVWGFEPQTYGLQSHRSSQLSYTPGLFPPEDTTNNSNCGLFYHRERMHMHPIPGTMKKGREGNGVGSAR